MELHDKLAFESLMDSGVTEHNRGNYQAALDLARNAYSIVSVDSSEAGRAARDMSARYDRLGDPISARSLAEVALHIHGALVERDPSRDNLRELSVSEMYVGAHGLRRAIQFKQGLRTSSSDDVLYRWNQSYLKSGLENIEEAKSKADRFVDRHVDQYEINLARRASLSESIVGRRSKGFALGVKAVVLSAMSESPLMSTSNPNMTTKQRLEAKSKALMGGVAALVVNVLASPKKNRRQTAALKLADKAL